MRRQLATSADNLSTQYPHNVLKKSPPKVRVGVRVRVRVRVI